MTEQEQQHRPRPEPEQQEAGSMADAPEFEIREPEQGAPVAEYDAWGDDE